MMAYHDVEWGVPVYDDTQLFEFLILEGAQAGLSWITVLKRRQGYRELFADFNIQKIANFDDRRVQAILESPKIIRNRLKVLSVIKNARAYALIQKEFGSFSDYLWRFVGLHPIQNHWQPGQKIPTQTLESDQLSKDLKRRGFSFVGSTIIYAYMQAIGLTNDHRVTCFRYQELSNSNLVLGKSP